jgi:hypothetical protein
VLSNLAISSGKVTALSGSTITVSGITLSPGSFGGTTKSTGKNAKAKKPTLPKTQTLKITTTGTTPVSATQTVAASALAVGDCVSAFGPSASNGSVTATTVRISSAVNGTCTGGFGFRTGGGGFGGAPGGPPGGSGA